ncbi:MAG: [FeFe] hydrogenase H-cluster radical SAM maturase HydE [Patescibacteria group bacterium]|nr:[FeFe] hydrogenase H-cluster radical SAM maturase HydE [Patescibacteria group bacterium]
MTEHEILTWLREERPAYLAQLWRQADRVRQENVGGEVYLRALVELSNHCTRGCAYCGLRVDNTSLQRYRLTDDEVLAAAHHGARLGCGTAVLQAGEDPGLTCERIAGLIRRVKTETPLAVTLSLGERSAEELAAWRAAGADRYLLRFETSNLALFHRIHPPPKGQAVCQPDATHPRLSLLAKLRELGYEVGSGVMIGIPGQTWADLAQDIGLFAELDLDMIGVGPYVAHPCTPLARQYDELRAPDDQQVPADELTTYKVLALTRLVRPLANIPSTTALAIIGGEQARDFGLERGANIVMPNFTPMPYRALYEIYPGKACAIETAEQCVTSLGERLVKRARTIGQGPGHSPNVIRRRE